ncbi:hypothetical protein D3C76_1148890 [compost metagenome]
MAMPRSFGMVSLTQRSWIRIWPSLTLSNPAIMRSRVDLAQPDGPTKTINSPSLMSRSTPCSALKPLGYIFFTLFN